MKTLFGLILVMVVAAVGGVWYVNSNDDKRPEFRTLPAQRGDLLLAVSATGTVEPVEVIDVGAQIVGRVKAFGPDPNQPGKVIDFGSHVKAGAILALLDDSPYLADVEKAKANLKLAQANAQRAQAQLTQVAADFKRAKTLRDTNSESDYDRAFAQNEMAKADVAVSDAQVEQAQIALQQAQINLSYATIGAPIDGIVIDRRVNVGQTVVAGLNAPSLFLLARDLSRLQVWAGVNEADIGEIRIGQKVNFRVDAYREQSFNGKVSQIRLNAGMSNNVVTYGVVVDIDNSDGALLPYMTANLQFEVARKSNVILVANQALRWQPSWDEITPAERGRFPEPPRDKNRESSTVETTDPTVWILADDGLVRPVTVKTGLTDGMSTEIADDSIAEGDTIVVGKARKAKRDFVSSFVSRVTGKGGDKGP